MNQMDERGLSPALIDPFASGMIQGSFGDPPPLVVRYILKGVQRALAHSVWHTWRRADGMRCYQLNRSIPIGHIFPLIRLPLT